MWKGIAQSKGAGSHARRYSPIPMVAHNWLQRKNSTSQKGPIMWVKQIWWPKLLWLHWDWKSASLVRDTADQPISSNLHNNKWRRQIAGNILWNARSKSECEPNRTERSYWAPKHKREWNPSVYQFRGSNNSILLKSPDRARSPLLAYSSKWNKLAVIDNRAGQ